MRRDIVSDYFQSVEPDYRVVQKREGHANPETKYKSFSINIQDSCISTFLSKQRAFSLVTTRSPTPDKNMDVVVHFETSTPSITFKRENAAPRGNRAERRAKSYYDAMTSGQKRRLCLRERERAIHEIRGIQRRLWLSGVILVIMIVNTALVIDTAPAIRSCIRSLIMDARSGFGSVARGGDGGDKGRGEGDEGQKDNSYGIDNSTITAIRVDLFNLDQQLNAAILRKFVHDTIGTDVLQDLSSRISWLISAKQISTPKEKPETDFCSVTRNRLNHSDLALGPAIIKAAQGKALAVDGTLWSQLRRDTRKIVGESHTIIHAHLQEYM